MLVENQENIKNLAILNNIKNSTSNIQTSNPRTKNVKIQNQLVDKKVKMNKNVIPYTQILASQKNETKTFKKMDSLYSIANSFAVNERQLIKLTGDEIKHNIFREANRTSTFLANDFQKKKTSKITLSEEYEPKQIKFNIIRKEDVDEVFDEDFLKSNNSKKEEHLKTENDSNNYYKRKNLEPINSVSLGKYRQVEKIDKKIDYQNFKLKVIDSQNNFDMLESFFLRGKNSTHFSLNNFDYAFKPTQYANPAAFNKFYPKYAQHRELLRKNVIKKETPSFAFIREIKSVNKVPNPLGLIKKTGNPDEINLNNQNTGDKYVNIIAKSISHTETNDIKSFKVSNNGITLNGLEQLTLNLQLNKKILKTLRILDLSNNNLGKNSYTSICNYIQESGVLKEINLENTGVDDNCVNKIGDSILDCLYERLSTFNFGKNNLTDNCLSIICELVEKCENLHVVQLHSNKFSNNGASKVIKSVGNNTEIKLLDLSNCKLGDNIEINPTKNDLYKKSDPLRQAFRNYDLKEYKETMKILVTDINLPVPEKDAKKGGGGGGGKNKVIKHDFFECQKFQKKLPSSEKGISPFASALGDLFNNKKCTLCHLDISLNNLDYVDCLHLEETVKENQTILGIHVDGNNMEIDELGFIHAIEKVNRETDYYAKNSLHYETFYNKSDDLFIGNNLIKSNLPEVKGIRNRNNCWICGNWKETFFQIIHPKKNEEKNTGRSKNEILEIVDSHILNSEENINTNENSARKLELVKNNNPSFKNSKNNENTLENENTNQAKIHLDFEKYKGFEMNYKEVENKSIIYRMCPPGRIKYFFSINNELLKNLEEVDEDKEELKRPIVIVSQILFIIN